LAIDWPALRAAAQTAARSAYAPYSRLQVGAAGQVKGAEGESRIVVGCNVENASFGLTLCAECGLVSALHASGGGTLSAVSVVPGGEQFRRLTQLSAQGIPVGPGSRFFFGADDLGRGPLKPS